MQGKQSRPAWPLCSARSFRDPGPSSLVALPSLGCSCFCISKDGLTAIWIPSSKMNEGKVKWIWAYPLSVCLSVYQPTSLLFLSVPMCSVTQLCLSLWPTPWTAAHQNSSCPGKNTGVGCHFLLQRIFLTQGSNLGLQSVLHWQVDFFYHRSHLRISHYLYLHFYK